MQLSQPISTFIKIQRLYSTFGTLGSFTPPSGYAHVRPSALTGDDVVEVDDGIGMLNLTQQPTNQPTERPISRGTLSELVYGR